MQLSPHESCENFTPIHWRVAGFFPVRRMTESQFVRESCVMILPQSLVEFQTMSDESHMITKRTIQSIRLE